MSRSVAQQEIGKGTKTSAEIEEFLAKYPATTHQIRFELFNDGDDLDVLFKVRIVADGPNSIANIKVGLGTVPAIKKYLQRIGACETLYKKTEAEFQEALKSIREFLFDDVLKEEQPVASAPWEDN